MESIRNTPLTVENLGDRRRSLAHSWRIPLILVLIPVLTQVAAARFPAAVERFYSQGIYPYLVRAIGSVIGVAPFSVAEVVLIGILVAFPVLTIFYVRSFVRNLNTWRRNVSALVRRCLCLLGILTLLFQIVWGLNYWRPSLAGRLSFDNSAPNVSELAQISRQIVEGINTNYELVHRDDILMRYDPYSDQADLKTSIEAAFRQNQLLPWPASASGFAPPKPLLFDGVVARLGISGIYSPFTAEPNYLDSMPGFDLPSTMAHEMAHARGFAREDEADFASFVVCTRSEDARLRYSGYLSGLRVLSLLARVDMTQYREVVKLLADGPRRDLKTRYEFWSRYRGRTSYLGNRMNDLYLKANGIKAGVKNYDEMTTLLVGYYRRNNGLQRPG
jgi:hypothetical protein